MHSVRIRCYGLDGCEVLCSVVMFCCWIVVYGAHRDCSGVLHNFCLVWSYGVVRLFFVVVGGLCLCVFRNIVSCA